MRLGRSRRTARRTCLDRRLRRMTRAPVTRMSAKPRRSGTNHRRSNRRKNRSFATGRSSGSAASPRTGRKPVRSRPHSVPRLRVRKTIIGNLKIPDAQVSRYGVRPVFWGDHPSPCGSGRSARSACKQIGPSRELRPGDGDVKLDLSRHESRVISLPARGRSAPRALSFSCPARYTRKALTPCRSVFYSLAG